MPAEIIDGRKIAAEVRGEVAEATASLADKGITPGLATVVVGDDPASHIYVRNKVRACEEAGITSFHRPLPDGTPAAEIAALLDELAADPAVSGILLQLPTPKHLDSDALIARIPAEKDVDGLTTANAGLLAQGRPGLRPCTPAGVMTLLDEYDVTVSGAEAVVVGRSNIVGKPMAQLLLAESCTVTVAHSRTRDLPDACRRADILVAAVGRPAMIRGDWIKPGAVVIDVGINRVTNLGAGEGKTRLLGDVAFAEAKAVASAITPVPGGVGPMTIACLLENTLEAALRRRGVQG